MSLFEQEFQLEPREPIDVAEVFRRVESSPHYYYALRLQHGMCWALSAAYTHGLVTGEEQEECSKALVWYLHQFTMHNDRSQSYLRTALHLAGLRSDEFDLRKIYKDWNNRPMPWEANK